MKKTSWLVAGCALSAGLMGGYQAEALDLAGRAYVGFSPMYAIERFKTEWTEIEGDGQTYQVDPDNSWGLNIKTGYHLNEYVAIEGLFQYFHKFKQSQSEHLDAGLGFGGADVDAEVSVKGFTGTLNGKLMLPLENFRPYAVAGLGFARYRFEGKADVGTRYGSFSTGTSSESESGPFARVGAGCDYFFTDHLALELEAAYNAGLNDISAARIISLSAGVVYCF